MLTNDQATKMFAPVHDGVGNIGPVAPEGLPLVGGPLVVLGVVHGLVQHGVDEGGVHRAEQGHALLILLRLAGNDVVLVVKQIESHQSAGNSR